MSQARRTLPSNSGPIVPEWVFALRRETLLFALTAAAVYLLLALSTYSPFDPGWHHAGAPDQIANLGGRFGAVIADLLMHFFGYTAFLAAVLLVVAAWRLYQQRRIASPPESLALQHRLIGLSGYVLTLVGACGIEFLHFQSLAAGQPFSAGGFLGYALGNSVAINFGAVGATVLLLAVFLVGLTWFGRFSWFTLMDAVGKYAWIAIDWSTVKIRERIEVGLDKFYGMRARRQREAVVREVHDAQFDRTPPRIEPRVAPIPQSERAQREKQVPLFTPNLLGDSAAAAGDLLTGVEIAPGELPPLSLLDQPQPKSQSYSDEELQTMSRLLEKKLADYNITVTVEEVHPGPVITRFEVEPAPGVKASSITGLSRDLARALSVVSVRVVENIPGKTLVGIEIPNQHRQTVRLVEGLSSQAYEKANSPLALSLGKDIAGSPVIADLTKMPHLLIAGTTGAGKSVCINALILSMVYKATPDHVRMIMVDPKMLELSVYEGIPHLLTPVVTDMQEAANALRWCIVEMERRFKLMAALGVRNIAGYNRKVNQAQLDGTPIMNPLIEEGDDPEALTHLPFIVVIIDELADLMMVVGKKVEELITRIAQRARAAGIHLILATQRPSVDVITGLLKANIPCRIAFQVSSRVDSRTVLDQMGAEALLGHGDMLFLPTGSSITTRVHGSFVDDHEVHKVVEALKRSGQPDYDPEVLEGGADSAAPSAGGDYSDDGGETDTLYDEALRFVTETRRASISSVQRKLRVGYNRAARMIEAMESAGVVGPLESNGKREVLAPPPPE